MNRPANEGGIFASDATMHETEKAAGVASNGLPLELAPRAGLEPATQGTWLASDKAPRARWHVTGQVAQAFRWQAPWERRVV